MHDPRSPRSLQGLQPIKLPNGMPTTAGSCHRRKLTISRHHLRITHVAVAPLHHCACLGLQEKEAPDARIILESRDCHWQTGVWCNEVSVDLCAGAGDSTTCQTVCSVLDWVGVLQGRVEHGSSDAAWHGSAVPLFAVTQQRWATGGCLTWSQSSLRNLGFPTSSQAAASVAKLFTLQTEGAVSALVLCQSFLHMHTGQAARSAIENRK